MKLNRVEDFDLFRETIKQCTGDVYLESKFGDRYNLKSTFSQYIALWALLRNDGHNLRLNCSDPEEAALFSKFISQD